MNPVRKDETLPRKRPKVLRGLDSVPTAHRAIETGLSNRVYRSKQGLNS